MKKIEKDSLVALYGAKFGTETERTKSYGMLESIVTETPVHEGVPNTEAGLKIFHAKVNPLSDQEFAFLVAHTGFIPDQYGDDSSEETLYTKLVEAVVYEWGRRLGFTMELPTAKSSMEDVTFIWAEEVVVADAKSFRLGRSQAAPNVKDAVKPEDYTKWQARHTKRKPNGGLITFPSKFDWRSNSDTYLYVTNAQEGKRILLFFYEHMAYLLLKKASTVTGGFFQILKNYSQHFKISSKQRDAYWLAMDKAIEEIVKSNDLAGFLAVTGSVVDECVQKAADRIEARIAEVERSERARIEKLDEAILREALIASEVARKTDQDRRRLGNIRKFRMPSLPGSQENSGP